MENPFVIKAYESKNDAYFTATYGKDRIDIALV